MLVNYESASSLSRIQDGEPRLANQIENCTQRMVSGTRTRDGNAAFEGTRRTWWIVQYPEQSERNVSTIAFECVDHCALDQNRYRSMDFLVLRDKLTHKADPLHARTSQRREETTICI